MLNGEGGELLQLRVFLNFILELFVRPIAPVATMATLSALLLATVPLVWVAGGLVGLARRIRGARTDSPPSMPARLARPLAVLASCVVVGALYPFVIHAFTSQQALAWSGGDARARAVLLLVGLGTLLSVALALIAVRAWRQHLWSFAGRLHYSAVATAALLATGLWWTTLGLS